MVRSLKISKEMSKQNSSLYKQTEIYFWSWIFSINGIFSISKIILSEKVRCGEIKTVLSWWCCFVNRVSEQNVCSEASESGAS
jgi:hypothetical protein